MPLQRPILCPIPALQGRQPVAPWAAAGLGALLALLAGCGPAPVTQGINDPEEVKNREMHAFNTALDENVVRPAAFLFGAASPGPVRRGLSNFAGNLAAPGHVVNDLMQGKGEDALVNTGRFVLNSTLGLGGLFDPAREMGIEGNPTDFGETLHVWGVGEGAYMELPFLGPSTERDTAGRVVDLVLDPLNFVLPTTEAYVALGLQAADGLGDRSRYSDTIDSVLYESADSYAQTRLLYLQNRRFELGQVSQTDDYIDPYEDPYAQ